MTEQTFIAIDSHEFALTHPSALDQHPVAVYLAGLSDSSRRVMATALAKMAELLTGQHYSPYQVARHQVRFQHVTLLRTMLAERYAPST